MFAWCALTRPRRRALTHSLFFKEEMELSLIGLNAAGKTSLVNVIAVRDSRESSKPKPASGHPSLGAAHMRRLRRAAGLPWRTAC